MTTYRMLVSEIGHSRKFICYSKGRHFLPNMVTTSDKTHELKDIAENVLAMSFGIRGSVHTFTHKDGLISICYNSISVKFRKDVSVLQVEKEYVHDLTGEETLLGLAFLTAHVIAVDTSKLSTFAANQGFKYISKEGGCDIEAVLTNCEDLKEGIQQFERLIRPDLPEIYEITIRVERDQLSRQFTITRKQN